MNSLPIHRSLLSFDSPPVEPLSENLKRWWREKPDLFEPVAFSTSGNSPSLHPDLILEPESAPLDSSCMQRFGNRVRAHWDRGSLVFITRLATPAILL